MTNLLPESTEEVNLLIAIVSAAPQLLTIVVFAPLVYVVVFGKSNKPAKRIEKFIKSWNRSPKA